MQAGSRGALVLTRWGWLLLVLGQGGVSHGEIVSGKPFFRCRAVDDDGPVAVAAVLIDPVGATKTKVVYSGGDGEYFALSWSWTGQAPSVPNLSGSHSIPINCQASR